MSPDCLATTPMLTMRLLTTKKNSFCEEDYAVTLYIAEFVNTLTNLAYSEYMQPLPFSSQSHVPAHR
jgi:hypothetical protein